MKECEESRVPLYISISKPETAHQVGTIFMPILQMKNLRVRSELSNLSMHTTNNLQNQVSNSLMST